MAQAFYRKWRSQDFGEVVGQEHVTKTLLGALRTGRLGHAYLFCGPRGTGKTSTARILAKAVNCLTNEGKGEPCNTCAMCQAIADGRAIDLIEMDAASNRGIDDIRELRDRVNFAPNEARYKVYIIDEVHQLTQAAFDALLKTLEEPPRHVIFILATTEAHEVPATILSRCQRFDFRRIPTVAALARLEHICKRENITIEPAALHLIVRTAGGSLRDAENLLDQVASFYGATIDVAHVRETLGIPDAELVRQFVGQLVARDISGGLHTINEVVNRGEDLRHFGKQLVGYLRNILLLKADAGRWADLPPAELDDLRALTEQISLAETTRFIRAFAFSETKQEDISSLPLELALVEALLPESAETRHPGPVAEPLVPRPVTADRPAPVRPAVDRAAAPRRDPAATAQAAAPAQATDSAPVNGRPAAEPVAGGPAEPSAGPPTAAIPSASEAASPEPPVEVLAQVVPPPPPPTLGGDDPLDRLRLGWHLVLEQLQGKDARRRRVQALLRDTCSLVEVRDGEVVLGFRYVLHKQKLEEGESRKAAEEAISAVLGAPHRVACILQTDEAPVDKVALAEADPVVQAAVKQGARLQRVT